MELRVRLGIERETPGCLQLGPTRDRAWQPEGPQDACQDAPRR
jgi:hypothetical protein